MSDHPSARPGEKNSLSRAEVHTLVKGRDLDAEHSDALQSLRQGKLEARILP